MGSSTSKPHFAKMKQCVDSLQQEDCHTVTEVIATVRWLDTINQQFAAAIASDLRTGLMTHIEITKKFVKYDPDLTKAKYVIMRDHYHDDYAAKKSGKNPVTRTMAQLPIRNQRSRKRRNHYLREARPIPTTTK